MIGDGAFDRGISSNRIELPASFMGSHKKANLCCALQRLPTVFSELMSDRCLII
jgi:hypothetical protein